MAGIGFELRRFLARDSYTGNAQAYGYAGILSAGPWMLSILVVLAIGAFAGDDQPVTRFQQSVTGLIAASLVWSGAAQLTFARFIADRVYAAETGSIGPNFVGMLALVAIASAVIAAIVLAFLPGVPPLERLLLGTTFVLLASIWVATAALGTLERLLEIVGLYLIGYAITVAAALALSPLGTDGLLVGFAVGQAVLLIGAVLLVVREYPAERLIDFEFLRRHAFHPSLAIGGCAFFLGVWIDKLLAWAAAVPGVDATWHLAYLAIVPGMAVWFVEIEGRFALQFERFFAAVRGGATIGAIERRRDDLVATVAGGLASITRVQSIVALGVIALAGPIVAALGLPPQAAPSLCLNVIAASLQVLLLAVITVFYYLDQRRIAALLALQCLALNFAASGAALFVAPTWFGGGFVIALTATVVTGLVVLRSRLDRLEYETFMLQAA